ncbi:MAG TPA: radical SAM protein [Bacteroidales bacterium]|nr:radical SAM protein [Bacteroidales bacterium]
MIYSKYNIFSKIKDSENYFILNLLNGNADILEPGEASLLEHYRKGTLTDHEFINVLSEKGYVVDEKEEKKLYRKKYLDFLDSRDEDEIQLFFVPNYTCNFACSYCYQDEYAYPKNQLTTEIIDRFFDYVHREFAGRRKYITIFGGEPLLSSPRQKEMISYLLEKTNEAGLQACIVTNGYTLNEYMDILKEAPIREIQVTMDGPATVHDTRRFLKGGGKTFAQIAEGIDACLKNYLPVNLRMVVDKENIESLPEFARFAIEKGWTNSAFFKTQLGRNYELHHCQTTPDKLFSRISMYEKLFELIDKYPEIEEFHKPAYSVTKFLAENGNLPDPLFDACPATKTEWAFDYTGQIYSCTATVGKEGESLGQFYPEVKKNMNRINEWEERDVTSIPQCRDCSLQLACGGGCGSVALNNNGTIGSTDCRPVDKLMELGFAAYFEQHPV